MLDIVHLMYLNEELVCMIVLFFFSITSLIYIYIYFSRYMHRLFQSEVDLLPFIPTNYLDRCGICFEFLVLCSFMLRKLLNNVIIFNMPCEQIPQYKYM